MPRLFGTDGVRGLANSELTPELALALSAAAARVLADRGLGHRPVAVVGRDPRASGEMLEAAVTAGLTSAGADVLRVGILPTPAVAHLVGEFSADLGVMISGSHNPMPDNGIKLFAAGGRKLPDAVEDEITARVVSHGFERPTGALIGRVREAPEPARRYVDHLLRATPQSLTGIRMVVDCAHGAASTIAAQVYQAAGADVVALYAQPDGLNINDRCGCGHLDGLRKAVLEQGATIGVAHDGDADRCLAVDATGEVVDGDQIMAILALAMREGGELVQNTLVATVMSNLGLHLAMREHGVAVRTTPVGDRYVLEALAAGGFTLGGEQSGHVVLPGYATTGDGLLTALRLMNRIVSSGQSLADLAGVLTRFPQVLINVAVADKGRVAMAPAVADAIATAEAELGPTGRVLLRPSGTEQLVRVMVEAPTESAAATIAHRIATVVATAS
ncbi:MAG: phosphoglucosamine mutase [Pseudonocardiaceae bacterium]